MKKHIWTLLLCALLCVALFAGCVKPAETPKVELKDSKVSVQIDINATTYVAVKLPELLKEVPAGVTYEATTSDSNITLSRVSSEGALNIISDGTVGNFTVNVKVAVNGEVALAFDIAVAVVNLAPDPTVKAEIPDASVGAPVFPGAEVSTNLSYNLDLSTYFDNIDNVTFEMECNEATATMTCDQIKPWLVSVNFKTLGEKQVTIHARKDGQRKVSDTFTLTLTGETPEQLINGDFENGFTGWNLDAWGYGSYNVINEPVDIWGNNIDAEGAYLYGFHNESGTCEFTSSLFKLSGTGMITWKMSGNCTDKLQLILMQYNPDGEDVEIAKFNNWYYGVYAASGFIFRDYWYQVDMNTYGDSLCYFVVVDNDTGDQGFGFLNLDSMDTHHATAPDVSNMYEAGYMTDPNHLELDYTDTSKDAFPSDLSTIGNQLYNGNFEKGYDGWYMTTDEKNAYAIVGSNTDIWSNPVGNTKNYLYGYAKENFATANFHSSLFKVDGSGMITWKMAGNSTNDLQFILMKYNPNGEDEVVETFNNWYFPISQESGFIFRHYYYQIDMSKYAGEYFYFVVKDYRNADFGFICLDDIVTYYAETPDVSGLFKAGFCTDPNT